jgi:hypothetical protein
MDKVAFAFLVLVSILLRAMAIAIAFAPVDMWIYHTLSYDGCICLLYWLISAALWAASDAVLKETK